jgi:hypothetical protein
MLPFNLQSVVDWEIKKQRANWVIDRYNIETKYFSQVV